MTRTLACLLLSIAGGLLALPQGQAAEPEDARLTAFFKQYLEELFRQRPLEATRLGDHRFDHLLDDVSPKARAAWTGPHPQDARRPAPSRSITRNCRAPAQIDFEIFKHHLTPRTLAGREHPALRGRPARLQRLHHRQRLSAADPVHAAASRPTSRTAAARMAYTPQDRRRRQGEPAQPAARVRGDGHPPEPRRHRLLRAAASSSWPARRRSSASLAQPARKVVAVLKEYQKFLENDLLPRAKGDWRLGKEKFARKLDLELDAGLTADEVLHEAEAEFDRVERDMYVIARQLWGQVLPRQGRCRPTTPKAGAAPFSQVLAAAQPRPRQGRGTGPRRPHDRGADQGLHQATTTSCGCPSPTAARSSRCRSSSAATPWPI